MGHTVTEGNGTDSIGIWITDVITGASFQASKLLLIIITEEAIPTTTTPIHKILPTKMKFRYFTLTSLHEYHTTLVSMLVYY